MQANTLHNIYEAIENRQWEIGFQRFKQGIGQVAFDGIAVLHDPLALEWQRLNEIKNHVGLHYCAARDREHGMKHAKCLRSKV
jgi:hypothetical protein